jgi:hypothetical protein
MNEKATESQNYRPGFYLRILGTAILMMAIADFLIQGLHGLTPDYRYWIMPGFAVLLAGCGLVCGYAWRDDKGARLFFALAAALVPVQFSQIGAMLHAHWHGGEPGFAGWFGVDSLIRPALLAANLALSLAVALPIAYMAFSILAKPRRASLLSELFLGCVLFLVPVRDANVAAALFVALFVVLRGAQARHREDALMHSLEGVAARALVFLPLAILIGRSVFLPWSWLTPAGLLFILAVLLFIDAVRLGRGGAVTQLAEAFGALAAILSAQCLIIELTPAWLAGSGQTMLHFLATAGLLFLLGEKASLYGPAFRSLGALVSLTGCFVYFAVRRDHASAMLFLGVGTVLVHSGIAYRQRWILFSGIVGFLAGMIFYAKFTAGLYQASPWLTMTGLGIAVLMFASFLEKKRKPLLALGRRWWQTVNAWER